MRRATLTGACGVAVYVYNDVLTLFSLLPYDDEDPSNTAAHITNTCVQHPVDSAQEACAVGLLRDLPAKLAKDGALSVPDAAALCSRVFDDCAVLVGDAFAAVSSELSFLPLPRSFELYGFDMLVDATGHVWILEANAEPDFAQSGDFLKGVVAGVVEGALALALDRFFPEQSVCAEAAGYTKVFDRADPRAAGSAMTYA